MEFFRAKLRAAERVFKLANAQFTAGVSTRIEFNTAQSALEIARLRLREAERATASAPAVTPP